MRAKTTKIEVTPVMKLNAKNIEENILNKIEKQIMKSSMLTAKTAPSGYITNKLKLHDKDSNDKIPIGNYKLIFNRI